HYGSPPVLPLRPRDLASYLPAEKKYWTCPRTGRLYEVAIRGNTPPAALGTLAWDAATTRAPHKTRWHVLREDGSVVANSSPPAPGKSVEIAPASAR
ncbi:MAG: hypothetical protein N2512_02205, partial [Armatimonadetes bacterium]|nr:hypothetical protein [Armatimonadota bacterium]